MTGLQSISSRPVRVVRSRHEPRSMMAPTMPGFLIVFFAFPSCAQSLATDQRLGFPAPGQHAKPHEEALRRLRRRRHQLAICIHIIEQCLSGEKNARRARDAFNRSRGGNHGPAARSFCRLRSRLSGLGTHGLRSRRQPSPAPSSTSAPRPQPVWRQDHRPVDQHVERVTRPDCGMNRGATPATY